ncbi:unnamed protein product [Rotaria sordida]|uniref:Uncharacterized protein n=1 Tax=Rotaria sordida TaxID=392033 RepID=A0A819K5E5_9BILA|nr:unnamed protein product [Rotaria sordida]
MVEVLYSLVDVNRRFDRLALDSLYINNLNMTDTMTINSFIEQPCSIDAEVISKISEKILPRIHSQVHKLTIEEFSIKPILLAVNYPQLYSLSLINFQEEMLYQHLTDDVILRDLLTKQITHLNIDIKKTIGQRTKIVSKIFALILSLCKKLTVFNFCHMFPTRKCILPICYLPSTNCMSLTLVKLTITVSSLLDCLYLFDGCLDSLSTLIINVSYIFGPKIPKYSKKKFLKLRCFSLSSPKLTVDYDDLIVPLLCQMKNHPKHHFSFYDRSRIHNGLNRNVSVASNIKQTTNVVKQKKNIKWKYLRFEKFKENYLCLNKSNGLFSCLVKEASSGDDSNNIISKDSFDDNMVLKKNIRRHTTISVGKQQNIHLQKLNMS